MRWLRRLLVAVLALGVLAAVVGAGWVVKVHRDNPRDEVAFIRDLDQGARTDGRSTFAPVDDEFLIAEGDRSCAWLREQPYPWWRRDDRFTFYDMVDRYVGTHPASRRDWSQGDLRPHFRLMVVITAWDRLCGEAWELREPHNPFNRPPAD